MNVLIVSHEYPPDTNYGGIATYMYALATELSSQGHSIHVISRSTSGISSSVIASGVVVHRLAYPSNWNTLSPSIFNELYSELVCAKIHELNQVHGIDVIETTEYGSELIKYTGDIPVVVLLVTSSQMVTETNRLESVFPVGKHELYNLSTVTHQEKFQTMMADVVVASSEYIKNRISKEWGIGLDKIVVVPLSIQGLENDTETQLEPVIQGKHTRVLFYGRIEPRKGPQTLISAITPLLNLIPDIQITMFGRDAPYGPNGSSFLRYLLRVGHDTISYKNIRFVNNWLSDSEKNRHIDATHVVVVPSLHESFGLVPLEVISRGKTVVVSNKMGITEYILHFPNVFVFNADDPNDLADKILNAVDYSKAIEGSGHRDFSGVSEELSISTIARKMSEVYQYVCSTKNSTPTSDSGFLYTPLISIMVVAFNELEYTRELVKSIRANTFYPYVINILDNGSTDGTRDWLLSIQDDDDICVFHSETNLGCAGGRNFLLEKVRLGDFVLFVDNDCVLGKNWDVDVLQYYKQDGPVGIVGQTGYNVLVGRNDRQVVPVEKYGKADMVTGYFMFMRSVLVRMLGDFDNEVASFWHEDDDYCIRAKHLGFTNLKVPVKVLHFEHKSSTSAGIEQSPFSSTATARRKHLVRKWVEMGVVVEGALQSKLTRNEMMSNIISSQLATVSYNALDVYQVRSALDTLIHLDFPWNVEIALHFLNYLSVPEHFDYARYFLRQLLYHQKLVVGEKDQIAKMWVMMAKLSMVLNHVDQAEDAISRALDVDPECPDAIAARNQISSCGK